MLALLMTGAAWAQAPTAFSILSREVPSSVSFGRTTFRIVSDITAAEAPSAILIDFAASPIEAHACMVLELSTLLKNLKMPVYATGGTRRNVLYFADLSNGVQLGLLSDTDQLRTQCEASRAEPPGKSPPRQAIYSTLDFLRAVGSTFAGKGPVRLIWIASDFRLYDWRNANRPSSRGPVRRPTDEPPPPPLPSVVEYLVPAFSAASISLFPLVVPHHPSDKHVAGFDAAQYLAAKTGGEAFEAKEQSGKGLEAALQKSSAYRVVTLEGPEPKQSSAGNLKLSFEPKASEERVFAYPPWPPVERLRIAQNSIRIVPFDPNVSFKSGCSGPHGPGEFFELQLPETVNRSTDPLWIHIEYLRPGAATLRQRLSLKRPGPLCVPLSDDGPGNSFILIAHDEATGWTGARRGVLSKRKSIQ